MLILWSTVARACDADLETCLESAAPLEERRTALRGADLRDPVVRQQLMRILVDGPLHDDLANALVHAGLVPAALAAQVPTRSAVAAKLGPAPSVESCELTVRADAIGVSCREHTGCAGACSARIVTAQIWGGGRVERGEVHQDDGTCGCCESVQ